jgi:hypothetical protein
LSVGRYQVAAASAQGRRDDGSPGLAEAKMADVAIVFDERDVVGPGLVQGSGATDDEAAVAVDLPLDQGRQFLDGRMHGCGPFLP